MPDFAGAFVKTCDKSCHVFCIFVAMKLWETVKVAFLYSYKNNIVYKNIVYKNKKETYFGEKKITLGWVFLLTFPKGSGCYNENGWWI